MFVLSFLCRNLHDDSAIPYVNQAILFGHKLSHLKFEIHVVMHLSHRRLQRRCQNINLSGSNALMDLKGDETLIGLLHVTPKPHLRVIRLLQGNSF
jgi:hypothetical protein